MIQSRGGASVVPRAGSTASRDFRCGLLAKARFQVRSNLYQFFNHELPEEHAPFFVQMSVIDFICILHRTELDALFLPEPFAQLLAARMQIDQRHVLFRSQFLHPFYIWHEARIDSSIAGLVPLPTNK